MKTKVTMEIIQNRLREAITLSKFKQSEIALHLNISPQTVSAYMTKDKFPALDTLANLCILLDVSSDYILGLE